MQASFGTNPNASLGTQLKIQLLESSLSKLFECLALECSCRKLVHPQWKHFKSMKLAREDRLRLNNALWRCWHIQYLKGKRPKFCGYVTPMTGESHLRSRAVILEGKYWRRRLEAVANEYKNWRIFYKQRKQKEIKRSPSTEVIDVTGDSSLGNNTPVAASTNPAPVKTEAIAGPTDSETALWNAALDEHDTMQLISSYSDTLFTSLVQGHPTRFYDGGAFADIIQPRLNMVQHSLYDAMGTFDTNSPLTLPPLPLDQQGMHTPLDVATPSASSHGLATANTAATPVGSASDPSANDAHMAAQQLILLMSSGKEADASTLKQLQMLLQSATNSSASPGQGANSPQQQQQLQQQQQQQQHHMSLHAQMGGAASSTTSTTMPPPLQVITPSPLQLQQQKQQQAQATARARSQQLQQHEPMDTGTVPPQADTRHYEGLASCVSTPMSAQLTPAPLSTASTLLSPTTPQNNSFFSSGAQFDSSLASQTTAEQSPMQHHAPSAMGRMSPSSVKSEKSSNPIVGKEERRKLHITAEQKRRVHIKNAFDELQSLVPSVSGQSTKISKAVLLQKSVEHMQHLQREKKAGEDEMERLRAEVTQLNESIMQCQDQLPVTGAPITRTRLDQTQQLFDHYVNIRTQTNYKFWIFSMIVRSLFDAYNNSVSTTSEDDMCRSVLLWFDQHCSLRALRPAVLSSLRQLSTSTSILSDPSKLSTEARSAASTAVSSSAATAGQPSPANAAAAAAANAAAAAALASTYQNPFPAAVHLQHHSAQVAQQQQHQPSPLQAQMQQLSYFADGGLPFLNPAFK